MSEEPRVIVTRPFAGLCFMGVCAVPDATDDEVLAVCNAQNPSGTTLGWCLVVRDAETAGPHGAPVACADNPNRVHLMVGR